MKLDLIQNSSSAISSVYIFKDFLENKNYLEHITQKIEEYTIKYSLDKKPNVEGNMTDWRFLLQDEDFSYLHEKILETLSLVFALRTPHPETNTSFVVLNSWGMRHKQGQKTTNHIHQHVPFSGAFYLKVPSLVHMWFDDFHQGYPLENNMLVLFQGMTKHSVFEHIGDKDRISMAFNIGFK
tara:strand:- start:353 stop:898 length:546 start_codon:yes stop_codon:yes gene_type:complete